MPGLDTLSFIDNPSAAARPTHYLTVTVSVAKVLKSWEESLFSYEWLEKGKIKSLKQLSEVEQPKRTAVEERLSKGAPLEKPILGIGILDNVEFGTGRATFLTLAALGAQKIPVHIPKTHEAEFSDFLAS